jgi:hypothetical protein
MQQRLLHRRVVEIAGLEPEEEIRGEGHDRCDRAEKFQSFRGQQIMEGRDRGQRHHGVQRGQQPAHPPLVELREGKTAARYVRLDDPGNQVSGDHEEDIDADVAAENRRRLEMEGDHRQHGDGAQPVDVFAIGAPHDRYAALIWPYRKSALRRAPIMSRVRRS